MGIVFEPIGIIRSPYKEKFGVPRQPGLVTGVEGWVEIYEPYADPDAFTGLDTYSHIWIEFLFDRNQDRGWQPRVRPPRLGGNRRIGLFASRSPYRPNPLGLSVVRLERLELHPEGVRLQVSGLDMVDRTPVLDIKPYVSYVDAVADAKSGYAHQPPEKRLEVTFSEVAERQLGMMTQTDHLREVIVGLLELDPRPAYRSTRTEAREYGMRLYDFDLRWHYVQGRIEVISLEQVA